MLQVRVTLLGDASVGKTSIRKNFMGEGFKVDYLPTIGADFAIKKYIQFHKECRNVADGQIASINNPLVLEHIHKMQDHMDEEAIKEHVTLIQMLMCKNDQQIIMIKLLLSGAKGA